MDSILCLVVLISAMKPTNLFLYVIQYEKVMKFISTAKSEGGTILCGGSRPEV